MINAARGRVIDESALYRALAERRILAAGLDTFEVEPTPPDNPLLGLDNVVATPHVAGSPTRYADRVFAILEENIARFLNGQELKNRVDLDPSVRDVWGFPAGRVTYSPHAHELVASAHAGPLHEAIMIDAGAQAAFTATSPPQGDLDLHAVANPLGIAPASKHVMGTTRMGTDPASSVVSPEQRLWDCDNVLVCDSSVFVTSSGYNPTLTLAALAHRAATLLVGGSG